MEYALQMAYNSGHDTADEDWAIMADETPVTIENRFGTFTFAPEQMLVFPQGLIGFNGYRRFGLALMPGDGAANNFRLLQSLDDASLSFIVWPTVADDSLLAQEDVETLLESLQMDRDALVLLHIATIREEGNGTSMTLNLKAPVVVDSVAQTAVQHVLPGDAYSVRHLINLAA